eukprot:2081184-Pleurochrysis_carterae.AAC.4
MRFGFETLPSSCHHSTSLPSLSKHFQAPFKPICLRKPIRAKPDDGVVPMRCPQPRHFPIKFRPDIKFRSTAHRGCQSHDVRATQARADKTSTLRGDVPKAPSRPVDHCLFPLTHRAFDAQRAAHHAHSAVARGPPEARTRRAARTSSIARRDDRVLRAQEESAREDGRHRDPVSHAKFHHKSAPAPGDCCHRCDLPLDTRRNSMYGITLSLMQRRGGGHWWSWRHTSGKWWFGFRLVLDFVSEAVGGTYY